MTQRRHRPREVSKTLPQESAQRALPDWILNPDIILKDCKRAIRSQNKRLFDPETRRWLKEQGISVKKVVDVLRPVEVRMRAKKIPPTFTKSLQFLAKRLARNPRMSRRRFNTKKDVERFNKLDELEMTEFKIKVYRNTLRKLRSQLKSTSSAEEMKALRTQIARLRKEISDYKDKLHYNDFNTILSERHQRILKLAELLYRACKENRRSEKKDEEIIQQRRIESGDLKPISQKADIIDRKIVYEQKEKESLHGLKTKAARLTHAIITKWFPPEECPDVDAIRIYLAKKHYSNSTKTQA